MKVTLTNTGRTLGRAGVQLLGNNLEAYQNTFPSLLSNRLRNPKFSGPENPQTGIAAEWEPWGNGMQGIFCRLIPGMYLSGREAQLIQNFRETGWGGIVQAGVPVRPGEVYEVEVWGRAQSRPLEVAMDLSLPGQAPPEASKAVVLCRHAHWHQMRCRIESPGKGAAHFRICVPGDSRLVLDQVHLRPAGDPPVSPALMRAMGNLPCPVLRFPGGCVSCTYHWEHGIGPVHLRPVCDDPVFKYKVHYDFGTDEYLDLCMACGIRPCITLNTSTSTPEEAAAWAAYIRERYVGKGLLAPPAYFIIGNENYGTWEIGHMTGEMYAAQLHAFVPAVRAAYPEARILAIGEIQSDGLREGYRTPWRSVVMEQAAGLFDMLVVTRYAWGRDLPTLAENLQGVAERVAEKAQDIREQAGAIRQAGLGCTLGVVEWNYWTRASHNDHAGFFEPNDIRHCLYAAGLLNAFARMGGILELANYYSLVNTMGMIHLRAGELTLSDVVKVFDLYAPALPGEVLELGCDCPMLAAGVPALDVMAVKGDRGLFAFLVNYRADVPAEVDLSALGTPLEARGLRADSILEQVQEVSPQARGTRLTVPSAALVRVFMRP